MTNELPLKATLKAGRDFDAPWLTVDGADPADLKFKLDALVEAGTIVAVVEAANALKAANNAAPLATNGPAAEQAPAQPQAPSGWGQQAQPQQQAAPQQPQRQQYGGTPHPEGKTCESCPKVLEHKKTQTGKAKWQCPDWRWNNGNPNGHTSEWIN